MKDERGGQALWRKCLIPLGAKKFSFRTVAACQFHERALDYGKTFAPKGREGKERVAVAALKILQRIRAKKGV